MKKLIALALAAVMLVGGAMTTVADETVDLENGLTAYYTFDNTLANAESETGVAKIHGGAGDTWNGGPTITEAVYADGKNGKAYSFAGNATVSGDGLELDVKTTDDFTIGMWVKTADKTNFQSVAFIDYDFDSFINIGTNFNDFASGALSLYGGWPHVVATGQAIWLDKNDAESVSNVKDLAIDTWTYVTFTCTKDGAMSLYYDGKLLADNTVAGYDGRFSDQYIFLGINFWDPSYKGLMDDVAVYNRVLSAAEVAALYENGGVPENPEPTPEPTPDPAPENPDDITPTGDFSMVLPLVLVLMGGAVVIVASKKRFA